MLNSDKTFDLIELRLKQWKLLSITMWYKTKYKKSHLRDWKN